MRQTALSEIAWEEVTSSNVDAVAFDEQADTIAVRFLSGGLYSYEIHHPAMPSQEIYSGLRNAESVGSYLHNVIKAFPFLKWDDESELISHLNNL